MHLGTLRRLTSLSLKAKVHMPGKLPRSTSLQPSWNLEDAQTTAEHNLGGSADALMKPVDLVTSELPTVLIRPVRV